MILLPPTYQALSDGLKFDNVQGPPVEVVAAVASLAATEDIALMVAANLGQDPSRHGTRWQVVGLTSRLIFEVEAWSQNEWWVAGDAPDPNAEVHARAWNRSEVSSVRLRAVRAMRFPNLPPLTWECTDAWQVLFRDEHVITLPSERTEVRERSGQIARDLLAQL